MSLSIVQAVLILFISLSFQEPNFVIAQHGNQSLLPKLCSGSRVKNVINPLVCVKILQSHKNIVNSKNPVDLSIAIIESGISNATNTQVYMKNTLTKENLDPVMKRVLVECNKAYNLAVASFRSALGEVKEGEYQTPSYDLLIASTDYIDMCNNVVAKNRINDETISIGNRVLSMFGFIGTNLVDDLDISRRNKPAVPPTINGRDEVSA